MNEILLEYFLDNPVFVQVAIWNPSTKFLKNTVKEIHF